MSDFETYNLKNSLKCSVSGLGNIKKRFLMVESCLEHISKLSLVRKIIFWGITSQSNIRIEADKSCFLMDGWKLCQKMRLDVLIIFLIRERSRIPPAHVFWKAVCGFAWLRLVSLSVCGLITKEFNAWIFLEIAS